MANQLLDRYISDLSTITSLGVASQSAQQGRMIALVGHQIEMQRFAALEISKSNLAAASVVVASLEEQSGLLTDVLAELGETITESIANASHQLEEALERMGDRVCGYLHEIRWGLEQQSVILSGILHTLRSSRNNEAQQLVQQGLRHLLNAQYDRAEERFNKALALDSTDYQVLMNLAFIEIHKGRMFEAKDRFMDALTLPPNLDDASRTKTLWALARLYHAAGDHGLALQTGQKALALERDPPATASFAVAGYASLAADNPYALKLLETAIRKAPNLFARAVVEPSFLSIRQEVLSLLSRLGGAAHSTAEGAIQKADSEVQGALQGAEATGCSAVLGKVAASIRIARERLAIASFAECLRLVDFGQRASEAVQSVLAMQPLYAQLGETERRLSQASTQHERLVQDLGPLISKEPKPLIFDFEVGRLLYAVIGGTAAAACVLSTASGGMRILALVMGATWPLSLPASLLELLFEDGGGLHRPIAGAFVLGTALGAVVAAFVFWGLRERRRALVAKFVLAKNAEREVAAIVGARAQVAAAIRQRRSTLATITSQLAMSVNERIPGVRAVY